MPAAHDPYAALRYRDFRFLLPGSMLASIGTEMQSVAIGWELYERTGSALALGMVGLVLFLPIIVLSLPAGHAADRYSRKGLLLVSLALMGLTSLGLAALSYFEGPVPLVYTCLLLAGTSRAFNMPARWAIIPQVVPAEVLTNAITWNSSGWQIAAMLGPALGGGVIALTGRATGVYLLAVGCMAGCAILLAGLRPPAGPRTAKGVSVESLLAGIHFVWRTKLILAAITLDLFAVLLGGATALLPIYAKDILAVGPVGLGWLRAAPPIGALLMAVGLAHRRPFRKPGIALLWAVAGFGAATIGFGLSENFVVSFALLGVTGALDNISVVVRGTLVQLFTPDDMRGRVSAVNAIFIGSSNELGAFESGITADWFGPVASVVAGGVGTIGVVIAVVLTWPEIQRLESFAHRGDAGLPDRDVREAGEEQPCPQPMRDSAADRL